VNLILVAQQFATEEKCLDYLEAVRWSSGVACLRCGSERVVRSEATVKARRNTKTAKKGDVIKTRRVYDCMEAQCQHQFSVTAGTIFHDSHLPLQTWMFAIAVFVEAKKSISALQMKRTLGLGSYKTAWHLCHRIREAMKDGGLSGTFSGTCEIDETYLGGRYDKRRKRAKYDKQPVIGIVERGKDGKPSQVKVVAVPKVSKLSMLPVLWNTVEEGAALFTDEAPIYNNMEQKYEHAIVNHSRKEYVRGEVHTNSVEGVWSLFNRAVVGSFHQIEIKHTQRYLNETAFKFNLRGSDLFRETITRMVNTLQLPMAELVSDPDEK
jgi:hypothetical protein